MAYNDFAYFYDELNEAADYDRLSEHLVKVLADHGIRDGIVADLGCGTGELTLRLAQAGYDMIAVDRSAEMLSVLQDKAQQAGLGRGLLLLCQDVLCLELYGTIRAAVSTFDTFNHIGPYDRFDAAIRRAAFFMEKGGVFVFDLNTPYKHREILGDNTFVLEGEDSRCEWCNRYDPSDGRVEMALAIRDLDNGAEYHERIVEYSYTLEQVRTSLEKHGFRLEQVMDGERFAPLQPDSQRMLLVAVKLYTQEEKE